MKKREFEFDAKLDAQRDLTDRGTGGDAAQVSFGFSLSRVAGRRMRRDVQAKLLRG